MATSQVICLLKKEDIPLFYLFIFAVMGFELKASHLVDKYSTA
jgi:hypothetical protein